MCKNYSRSRGEFGKKFQEPYSRNVRGNIPSSSGVRKPIGEFQTDILGEMGSQLDSLQAKKI